MPPQAQTVDLPKRLPLVITPENRAYTTDKDSKLVNGYMEKMPDGTYWIYKRMGLSQYSQPPGGAAVGRGVFNWLGDIYSIFGNTLYKNGVAVSGTLDTTNGVYKFSSCLDLYTPNVKKMQLGNGVKAYNYDAANGLVLINDAQFPAAFVKGWAYLDSVTYVATAAGAIYGSEPDDPINWTALNVVYAAIEPDLAVGLAKQLVYVVVMKQWSTEVFYDAQNATGSPLGPVQGAKVNYGCVTADSIVYIDGTLIWVCTNQSSATQVIKMDGLKAEIISTPSVERLLDEADFTTTYAYLHKDIGHRFYVLTVVEANLTLVYDLESRMWSQWTDVNGNYFPFIAATYNSTTMNHILQHESNGCLCVMDQTYYTDEGDIITVDIVTPNFDGETNRRKQLTMMKFVADQVPGSVLQVRKNDQDYAADKWSNFRSVDLAAKQPLLSNCGTFVRRAYHLRHQSNTPFRLKAIELQIDIGTL